VNSLEERKRELLAQSEAYRQAMALEIRNIKASVFWIPRTVQTIRKVSPFLVWGAPLLGILIGRRISVKPHTEAAPHKKTGRGKGLLATALGAIALYRKVRPILDVVIPMMRNARRYSAAQGNPPQPRGNHVSTPH
jgi:hypothetical protein